MQLSSTLNLTGAVLIVTAIVLHIVCLATPYWVQADSKKIVEGLKDMMMQKASKADQGIDMEDFNKYVKDAGMLGGNADFNYGLWKMCVHAAVSSISFDFCGKWASKTETSSIGMVTSFKAPDWIRGAQAMAILGLLASVAAAVLAGIHLFVPSRGDRLRLLPAFVCVAVFVAGVLVLIGDIILAAKYDKVLEALAEDGKEKPQQDIVDLVESFFSLSWGFALDVVASALLFLSGLFYLVGGKAAQAGGLV